MKKIISLIIAIAILVTIGTLAVFADKDQEIAYLNSGLVNATAESNTTAYGGYGMTLLTLATGSNDFSGLNPSTSVTSTFEYIDESTVPATLHSQNRASSGANSANTLFTVPSGMTMYRTTSTHTANSGDQTWGANTQAYK